MTRFRIVFWLVVFALTAMMILTATWMEKQEAQPQYGIPPNLSRVPSLQSD